MLWLWIRSFRRRDGLERYSLAIQEAFVNGYVNHTADLIVSMFRGRRTYGVAVLREALSRLEGESR